VLQMWYPGDAGGAAAADLLLGRADPAGRLPFTWPVSLGDTLAHDPRHPARTSNRATRYDEGIFIGYRWFDQQHLTPLYPFGFGLSYTRFDYSDLTVRRAPDGGLQVSFELSNVGAAAGDEVPQVYLGAPAAAPAGAQFALRALAGFTRVHLAAGEGRRITVQVPARELQYWDSSRHGWQTLHASRPLDVGASSRDLRLRGTTPLG